MVFYNGALVTCKSKQTQQHISIPIEVSQQINEFIKQNEPQPIITYEVNDFWYTCTPVPDSCDISSEALKKLKQFIPDADTKELDITEGLPFEDSFTKIIIADLSLHYFSEEMTQQILSDIHRVLQVNGVLLCRVNSTQELINNYNGADAVNYYSETDDIKRRFFDEKQIRYYFNESIWEYINIQEYEMHRYSKPKMLWEIAIVKKE